MYDFLFIKNIYLFILLKYLFSAAKINYLIFKKN